jgi:hypothetical protein
MHKYPNYPKKVSDLNQDKLFIILKPITVTMPGDERSRTNPGHGYPEYTESYWNMSSYDNEQDWKAEIIRMESSKYKEEYKALMCIAPKIETSVNINTDIKF